MEIFEIIVIIRPADKHEMLKISCHLGAMHQEE